MIANINMVEACRNLAMARLTREAKLDGFEIYESNTKELTSDADELFIQYYNEIWDEIQLTIPPSYQEEALRTLSDDYAAIEERLRGPQIINMLHSAIGLCTEAAEALDMLKKHIYYGKPLDIPNFREEIGDGQWYAAIGAEACGTNLDAIQATNIRKLKARYPGKFTEQDAENRDLATERKILEDE